MDWFGENGRQRAPKRGDTSTDGKKIKVDHTYLFVKQAEKFHHLLENLVKPF